MIDLVSNDYLSLARDDRVVEAACDAARRYGSGAASSRVVAGTLPVHADLETALASFLGQPAVAVCSTGYHANLAAITTLVGMDGGVAAGAEGAVVLDAHAHASLVDGARLSRSPVWYAAHRDLDDVEALLRGHGRPGAVVAVESVYSVLGDAPDLAGLAALAERYAAWLLVDEAHGLGVAGPGGRGLVAAAGLGGHPRVVITGTLSKSLASQGGFVAGPAALRERLVSSARPFVYDTGLAPAAAGAALRALEVLEADPSLVARVRANAARLAAALGLDATGPADLAGAVCSVPETEAGGAAAAAERLAAAGVAVGVFRRQSTPDRRGRVRVTAHAGTSPADLDRACSLLEEARGG